jgi:Uma2 family endonuclease
MSVMTSVIPHGRPFTVEDLEGIPDDGNRYELIDGMLFVSPAPVPWHQLVLGELFHVLRTACPRGLLVLFAPLDVQPDRSTSLQPDVLVAPRPDFGPKNLPVAPLLAAEVLSPSTRLYDLNTKRSAYERMGGTSYWIVDLTPPGALTVLELAAEGRYQQVAHVEGDEEFVATRPFPVTLVPARLLDGLRPRQGE